MEIFLASLTDRACHISPGGHQLAVSTLAMGCEMSFSAKTSTTVRTHILLLLQTLNLRGRTGPSRSLQDGLHLVVCINKVDGHLHQQQMSSLGFAQSQCEGLS